ncbi:hypothetical protein NPIL_680501 [Nephila pilipes]|uniref:Uncharacterized protein n=1 Tax=Nephila pilipes TaxID=299642 RepID=A0A8X6NKZ7_NEPPI|nr:hypothetical protein NPIL_680501 [Nephila pilipes]
MALEKDVFNEKNACPYPQQDKQTKQMGWAAFAVLTEGLFNKNSWYGVCSLYSFYSFSWCIHALQGSSGMEMSSPSGDSFCKSSSFALWGSYLVVCAPFSSTPASISSASDKE